MWQIIIWTNDDLVGGHIYASLGRDDIWMCSDQSLQWRHNERGGVSNHQPPDYFTQPFIQAQMKENIKAPRHWPLWGEFTCDRSIPHTKSQ